VGLRREDIDDIDIALTGPAVLNLFNVCDVLVQYRIFLDHIVNQAPRCSVEDQHFPVALGNLSDGVQNDVPLSFQDGNHGGEESERWALERATGWMSS